MMDQNELSKSILKERYKIQNKLGEGGMGQVYLAIDMLNQRPVAVKCISISHKDENSVERLSREYRILQMVEHPNIVKGYDFFEENGRMFLVMEFIAGISMKDYIRTNPNPLLLEKLAMGNQLCRAVEVLNTAGVLHRDLKPANIIVNKATGKIKLLDMGLGKKLKSSKGSLVLTREGDIVGTPAYLSPEQVRGKVSEKSDVFALGIVLYQLFVWQKSSPFQAESSLATMIRISEKEIADLKSQLSKDLNEEENRIYKKVSDLISQALIKDVDKRLSSAQKMGDELERLHREWKDSLHRPGRSESSPKVEPRWETSNPITMQEMEKLQAFKEELERESKKSDIKKSVRTSRLKTEAKEQSWSKKLFCVLVVCFAIPIALSFALSSMQERPKAEAKRAKNEKKENSGKSEMSGNEKTEKSEMPGDEKADNEKTEKSEMLVYGLPPEIWNECKCQHEGRWMLDMTTNKWGGMPAMEQRKYAQAYQKGYAIAKRLDIEKTIHWSGVDFVMRLIPPGRFWMGSNYAVVDDVKKSWQERNLHDYDETKHRVIISKAFWMQKTEITQKQWKAITGTSPWSRQQYMEENEQWPAAYISWNDVNERFLPRMESGFDLPTEAQWEYACRAGTTSMHYWGESESELGQYANSFDLTVKDSGKYPSIPDVNFVRTRDGYEFLAPVQSLKPNSYGLHDMTGNLWEWCKDFYSCYPSQDTADPAVTKGTYRAQRGGSWNNNRSTWNFRSATRSKGPTSQAGFYLGARLVLLKDI